MKVKVGIVGCGVVGTGVVELLLKNSHTIRKKTGIELQISKVADKDSLRSFKIGMPPPTEASKPTHKPFSSAI